MSVYDYEKFLPTHPARMFRLGDIVIVRLPILDDAVQIWRAPIGNGVVFYARVADVRGSFAKGEVTFCDLAQPEKKLKLPSQTARANTYVLNNSLALNPSHLGHYFEGDRYVKKYAGYARSGVALMTCPAVWQPYERLKASADLEQQFMREPKATRIRMAGENALREIREMFEGDARKEAQEKRSRRAYPEPISQATDRVITVQYELKTAEDCRTSVQSDFVETTSVRLLRDGKEASVKGPFYIVVDSTKAPVAAEQITPDIIKTTGEGNFCTFAEGAGGYFTLEVKRAIRHKATTLPQTM